MFDKYLPERQRAWSARTACLFSQDILKGAHGRLVVVTCVTALGMGGGICFDPPPPTPNEVMHVCTPFVPRGLRGEASDKGRG
jgi:hypothetical protein